MQQLEKADVETRAITGELLNLGCGKRYREGWVNVDFCSESPAVRACDLRKGVPFADGRFAMVYHSHVLEHFSPADAAVFLRECWRVTQDGGLIRVAVPDLEQIAKTYLQVLGTALHGTPDMEKDHAWMTMELVDQLCRHQTGGHMRVALETAAAVNRPFVVERLGVEALRLLPGFKQSPSAQISHPRRSWLGRLQTRARNTLRQLREASVRVLLGDDYTALQVGRFRRGGEVHLWMYDRFSLCRALEAAGFVDTEVRTAWTSSFPEWTSHGLDVEPDGTVYKPDSLFVEARKR